MTAPGWIDAIVRQFGEAAGLRNFSLNARGAATARFENGLELRFEYTGTALAVAATVPAPYDPPAVRRLLAYAHPDSQRGPRIRTGILPRSGRAVFAVAMEEREATLPAVNAAFDALWRSAREFGGLA